MDSPKILKRAKRNRIKDSRRRDTEEKGRAMAMTSKERFLTALRDGGEGGGLILSTGDPCGRETPEENLHALVRAAHEHGVYDAEGRLPGLPRE